jgi:hypothetical protein
MNTMRRTMAVLAWCTLVAFALTIFPSAAHAAARSVIVNFANLSDTALVLAGDNLDHGCWTVQPPARIEAGSTVTWESESCGFLTGTEGEADFTIETGGSAHFHWDNPFAGSNSYDESVIGPGYLANHSGGGGNNATVFFTFNCSSATCDGIPDDWKRNGVTIDPGDGSGPQFIDLPNMGATVNKPDIFVQLDWMADNTHSHQLSSAEIQAIVNAFANSPFVSRTGSVGINLHVDHGPASILNFNTNTTWGNLSRAHQQAEVTNLGTGTINNYNWSAFDAIKNQANGFKSTGRSAIFHYAIAAHQISTLTNSGVARSIPGSDFIISLGSFANSVGTANQRSGALMHELGHNLGLRHGGGDNVNFKPNYLSVMNYSYWSTLTKNGNVLFDYSRAALPTLNESNLSDSAGIGSGASGFAVGHQCPGAAPGTIVTVAAGSGPIDWACDGKTNETGLSVDVNGDGTLSQLVGFDDWKNLKLKGGAIGVGPGATLPTETVVDEITPEQNQLILPVDTTPPVTVAIQSPPPNANGWNNTDVTVRLDATDDISGVALTQSDLDGAGWQTAPNPITITPEGIHVLQFRSIDRAQNVEETKQVTIRIDRTPPEAVIQYDPSKNDIVVTGRDALSGTPPGPVPPSSVVMIPWNDFGSDEAECRTYRIEDLAGNSLVLIMKVRRERDEMEIGILTLRYNHGKDAPPAKNEDASLPKNTIEFEQLRGRGLDHCLLAVRQEVRLGRGEERSSLDARYTVLDDETSIKLISPVGNQEIERQGLVLIRIVTNKGTLVLEY